MDWLSSLAAFGIWPAIPLLGWWLLRHDRDAGVLASLPSITALSLMAGVGLTVWSIPVLGSAIAGFFRGTCLGIIGWGVTFLLLPPLFRAWYKTPNHALAGSAADRALFTGVVLALVMYIGFSAESIHGGRDMGTYANHAIYIAHHGRLDVPYPWPEEDDETFRPFNQFPGFYNTEPTMTAQFAHLYPAWLAQAFSTFKAFGLFHLNGVLALIAFGVFYGLCLRVVPQAYATLATLFLAFNPSQMWLAHTTLTEILTQLFIWSGLLAINLALTSESRGLARWAGAFFGCSALARIDSLFLVPLLLLTHIALKIVTGQKQPSVLATWVRIYQTAAPLFVLAVVYYALWSFPYFRALLPRLRMIGLVSLGSLSLLLLLGPRLLAVLQTWLTARQTIFIISILMVLLVAYAYWLRPYAKPYATLYWPGHRLDGYRDFRENSLVNLGRYLTPFTIGFALFGWLSLLSRALKSTCYSATVPILVIVFGFSTLYLWNPSIAPDHFWAIRRFVPVIIPGFLFFGIAGLWLLLSHLSAQTSTAAFAIISLLLLSFTTKVLLLTILSDGRLISENAGLYEQLEDLASKLPPDSPVLSEAPPIWSLPLYVSFGKRIIPLDPMRVERRKSVRSWVARRKAQGKRIYLLCEGMSHLPELQVHFRQQFVLRRCRMEGTTDPLPKKWITSLSLLRLYEVTGVLDE